MTLSVWISASLKVESACSKEACCPGVRRLKVRMVCFLVRSLGGVPTVARIALWSERTRRRLPLPLICCISWTHQHIQDVLAPGGDFNKRDESRPLGDFGDIETIEVSSDDYICSRA